MSKQSEERHNELGEEVLDPTPMQPPLGHKKTPTLREQIMQQVRLMKQLEADAIEETEEEADDFEVGDDFEPLSKYENDHIPSVKVLKGKIEKMKKQIADANRRAAIAAHEKAKGAVAPPEGKEPVVNPGADPSPGRGSA